MSASADGDGFTTSAGASADDTGASSESDGDGTTDCTPTAWFADADGDGFGDPMEVQEACAAPPGAHVDNGDDCDDAASSVHPDAAEICDGVDNDCDLGVDEGSPGNAACNGCTFVISADAASYFALCTGPLSWQDARDACAAFGPGVDLAIVDDPADDATLLAQIGRAHV